MNSCNTRFTDYNWHRVNAARLRGEAIGSVVASAAERVRALWRKLHERLAGAVHVR